MDLDEESFDKYQELMDSDTLWEYISEIFCKSAKSYRNNEPDLSSMLNEVQQRLGDIIRGDLSQVIRGEFSKLQTLRTIRAVEITEYTGNPQSAIGNSLLNETGSSQYANLPIIDLPSGSGNRLPANANIIQMPANTDVKKPFNLKADIARIKRMGRG